MNGLDLFSGIGGISYALQDWIKPVAYCEIEPYCQSVLLQRMREGNLPKAPIWDDIRTLTFYPFFLPIDIIYGGFPCQDISVAGAGKGLEGERSGLFFEIMRLAKEIKPTFLFLENVPAITCRGGLRVVKEITTLGYDCRWCVISAAKVGALHRRERWFLLGHSKYNGSFTGTGREGIREMHEKGRSEKEEVEQIRKSSRTSTLSSNVADSTSKSANRYAIGEETKHTLFRECSENDGDTESITSGEAYKGFKSECEKTRENRQKFRGIYRPFKSRYDWQETVNRVGKCSDGVSSQVDQLRALGNAVVPQQVRRAWDILFYGK